MKPNEIIHLHTGDAEHVLRALHGALKVIDAMVTAGFEMPVFGSRGYSVASDLESSIRIVSDSIPGRVEKITQTLLAEARGREEQA